MNEVAKCLTSPGDLRDLAVSGLHIQCYIVERSVANYKGSVSDAAYDVLRHWLDSQASRADAHRDLCEALKVVGRTALLQQLK